MKMHIAPFVFGAAWAWAPVFAQSPHDRRVDVSATATLATDYVSRGISLTQGQPAYQASLDLADRSGLYVGGFVSRARFAGSQVCHEIDAAAGVRRQLGGVSFDIGGSYYAYPTSNYSYGEAVVSASRTFGLVTTSASLAYAGRFFGVAGRGWYLQSGIDVVLPQAITVALHGGRQWSQHELALGLPDYSWLSISASRALTAHLTLSLALYGSSIPRSACAPGGSHPGGQGICHSRLVLSLSKSL